VAVLEVITMRLKYQMFVLAILLMAISGANAVYDYFIPVGTHEIKFNTSLPIWERSGNSLGYESQYLPTSPMGLYDNPTYTWSSTLLKSDKVFSELPLLSLTVRDFEGQIPWNVMSLEMDTLGDFIPMIPGGPEPGGTLIYGGDFIILTQGNNSSGAIIKWPSDRTEIIITGILPSIELWRDISNSTELVR
jgi:hypothetical protein